MKIAMVFDLMLWGGIERVGISYAKLFVEAGHSVDAYILNPKTESILEELKAYGNVRVLDFKKNTCPENRWGIIQYQDRHGLEIVYFASVFVLLSIKKCFLKNRYRIDKTYDLAIAFSGHINDLTFVADNYIRAKQKLAWLHGTQSSYNMLSPGFFRLYRKIKNLVCLSEMDDIECLEFNNKYHVRKRKIYNPCVVNQFEPNDQRIHELKERFGDYCLMVARLAPDKDQETVIKAIEYLRREYGINKHLVLVGDGERKDYLKQLVHKMDLDDWVHFEGSRKDVNVYYLSAQMLVHAAPLEGLPTVFLEAMYYRLPIVSTDAIPGAREILGNSEFGLISPDNSHRELAKNIKRLHDDSLLREKFAAKGEERLKDFAPMTIKQQIEDYINEIMIE